MILLLLAILSLLHVPFVCSSPLPSLNGISVTTFNISDPPSSNNTRTLWEIIWSCAATLFACTWTAIHPNIPGMDEGKFTVTFRRLGIMMVALIAPELMITWAAAQFLSARNTAKAFNDAFGPQLHQACSNNRDTEESTATLLSELPTSDGRNSPHLSASHTVARNFKGWTVTHGFFAWMGGFMLYVNDEPRATLTPEELERFVSEGSVEMPVIVEADIEDRSKGDALSKGIVILQLTWFVIQLVARYVQNLPMTLIELDTFAVAVLTSIVYGFWWKKPKDVGRPHPVYWKSSTSPPSRLACEQVNVVFSGEDLYDLFLIFTYPLMGLIGGGIYYSPRAVRSRRVPTVGGHESLEYRPYDHDIIILFIGCFCGAVFGSIHCLGWNLLFQGHAERILWRTASIVLVSASVSILLLSSFAIWSGTEYGMVAVTAAFSSALIYIFARITLVVLILMSFRSLPPGIYDTVAWTEFIPHL